MFTASKTQVATYLLVVCPFSIAFLVFLNSSVSFVITDLLGQEKGVGDAVGTLGFADELLALLACPLWGGLSDRIGVRTVCFGGYFIIGIALFVFVQAKHVYPDLLLGRLLFSLGGSAASTMVTAVLPTMSFTEAATENGQSGVRQAPANGHAHTTSVASERTITPTSYRQGHASSSSITVEQRTMQGSADSASKIAGFVGMATGCGALFALTIFLPLPARFQKNGTDPGQALQYSYYIVGSTALLLGFVCLFGLNGLRSDKDKGWRHLIYANQTSGGSKSFGTTIRNASGMLYWALHAGFSRRDVFIGYVGGFVARASSVGISLFVPLLVNAAFSSSGLCKPEQALDKPSGLPDIKRQCPRAYVVAAELTGVSQLVALLCAPLFGYWSSRVSNKNLPLMAAAAAGIVGYPLFATRFDPHDDNVTARIVSFFATCLIGISQIGAIVCSLAILSRGIIDQQGSSAIEDNREADNEDEEFAETEALIRSDSRRKSAVTPKLTDLKGSVAGIYSFYGGAGILILTKAGGALFDSTTNAAPFIMMASFNAILLIACLAMAFTRT